MSTLVARAIQRAQINSQRDTHKFSRRSMTKNNSNPRYSRPHILRFSFQGRGFSIIILNNSQNIWRWLGEPTGYVSISVCVWVWVCVRVSVCIILSLSVCGWSECVSVCLCPFLSMSVRVYVCDANVSDTLCKVYVWVSVWSCVWYAVRKRENEK